MPWEACFLPSRILQYSRGDRPRTYKKVIHNTGWNRLEKTVIKMKGKITGGAVGEKGFMEETGLGHEG